MTDPLLLDSVQCRQEAKDTFSPLSYDKTLNQSSNSQSTSSTSSEGSSRASDYLLLHPFCPRVGNSVLCDFLTLQNSKLGLSIHQFVCLSLWSPLPHKISSSLCFILPQSLSSHWRQCWFFLIKNGHFCNIKCEHFIPFFREILTNDLIFSTEIRCCCLKC